jgi:hypothetical protein
VLGEGAQKNRDHVGPALRLGDRLQTEFAIEHMQIVLWRNDEHAIRPDIQFFGDQFHRHRGEAWKNLVKLCRHVSHVIDDDNRDPHVRRQIGQQPGIGVKPAG